jgi:hypothetical protein
MLVARVTPGNPPIPTQDPSISAQDRPFIEACQTECVKRGGSNGGCRSYCVCTAGELKRAGLWENVLDDRYTPEIRQRLATAMQACASNRGQSDQH